MRKYIFMFVALAALTFAASCEKDEDKVYINPEPAKGQITVPSAYASIILKEEEAGNYVHFEWTSPDYGFDAALTSIVQMDKAGGNFAEPINITSGSTSERDSALVSTLNSTLIGKEYEAGVPANFVIRIRSILKGENSSPFADTIYSKVQTISIIPYYVETNYPVIYMPGDYPDREGNTWNPATTNRMRSYSFDTNYEGYATFTNATTEFKFTSQPDWNGTNYGDSGTEGTLSTDGGAGNLAITGVGSYFFKVNTSNLTWSYSPYNIGIVGDATPNGWNTPDSKMTYVQGDKPADDYWTIDIALTVGEIKFRLNDDWSWNLGGSTDNLTQGAGNIPVGEAGTYTINLYIGGEPMYCTITKN